MELTRDNEFSVIGSMLNNNGVNLSTTEKQERKFLFLEGLIRFLELYAQNEIGNVEVDIAKIALWINSPYFENVELYKISDIESVYNMITSDIFRNIPIYRFLKLSDYQKAILEKDHLEILQEDFKQDCEKYPCLKCIWYKYEITQFGKSSVCTMPKDKIEHAHLSYRRSYHNIEEHIDCKYCTTINNANEFMDKYVNKNVSISSWRKNINDTLVTGVKNWKHLVNTLDNSYIPIMIDEEDNVDLSVEIDPLMDLARVFGNKLTKKQMQDNLRFAIFLEAMIKFVEIYAQTEVGSNYFADIRNIAKYVSTSNLNFKSEDEVYEYLENTMIDDSNFINQFIKIILN